MSVETFQNLIEIQSLLDRKSKHFATIEEEKLRLAHIDKVNDRKTIELNDATDELQTLKHELASGEKRISEINALLEKMKEDFYTLKSEKEMETFKVREKSLQEEKETIEESLFLKLEIEEQLNEKIENAHSFQEGFRKTREDIFLEVQTAINKEQVQIDGYQMRIDALVAELPKEAMANYNAAIKKYPTKFLSFVETIRCGVCRYEIERNTVALIDRAQVFELCGSCGRLLAPKHLPSKVVID